MNLMSKLSGIARSPGDPEVIETGPGSRALSDNVARGLGWFSIALGVVELVAPGRLARALGLEGREGLLRAYGVRELAAGRMCLSVNRPTAMWSRVAGDAVDIATLLYAYNGDNPRKKNVGVALAAVGAITLLDLITAQALTVRHGRNGAQPRDYSDRSGWPQGLDRSRGIAAREMRPDDMRSYERKTVLSEIESQRPAPSLQ